MQTIHHTIYGKGEPVLLVHGFCESETIWERFIPSLATQFQVITMDLGGFGKSASLLPQPTSIDSLAVQLHDLALFLHLPPFVLVGHSLGGYVGLAFAEKYPHLLRGLGLFHSTALPDSEEKQKTRNHVIQFVEKNGVAPFIENFVPPLFFNNRKNELEEAIRQVKEIALQTPQQTLIEITRAMRDRPDRTAVLQNASFPIMWIIGKEDQAVLFDSYTTQIILPEQTHIHIFSETAHMGMFERPQETLICVKNFLEIVFEQ